MISLILSLIGLALGIIIGYYIPVTYPDSYSLYISVGLLAAMDSVFGAIRATLEGKYDGIIFVTGFFGNAILAGILAYIGDRLGFPLYYASIFVFGGRLFQNFAIIRRYAFNKLINKKRGN
ncbi:small basic family protein [Tepidibacter aestuarii]|uniref:small basic family protein n=1 Tax=Tepidibacter aestuarii TaxID=2925782 RepID=UPI002ED2AC85